MISIILIMIKQNKATPWVEKYRPTRLDDIVLDPINKTIMNNILKYKYFPNMLLYGPPGTGKTTTIINLINKFQEDNNQKNKGLMIHLNASDERGIDIIRNQINQFVNSKSLFVNGIKFVILDEVDYMTKNAQQALKYLLQGYNNIRFCLICNYLSKIDISLQNEFLRLRFNQLPQENIINFLNIININESLNLSNKILISIQALFKSDIRSMINYIQLNHNNLFENKILDDTLWIKLIEILKTENDLTIINEYIDNIILNYNIELSNLLKNFFNFYIRSYPEYITEDLLTFIEFIIRINNNFDNYMKKYFIIRMKQLIN
jgi:DNA polymerase III delta prime subunit